jgi:hypothetical protein
MSNNFYITASLTLFFLLISLVLFLFLIKKIKGKMLDSNGGLIKILARHMIDRNKFILVIEVAGDRQTLLVTDNYSLILAGGESRIRTYERTGRADLQSAAFGHSAISPE